jgi:hypothetical protein
LSLPSELECFKDEALVDQIIEVAKHYENY